MGLMSLQGFTETDRWFDVAVKVAKEFMKSHIISSDNDRIAVVFYGSVSSKALFFSGSIFSARVSKPHALQPPPNHALSSRLFASMLLEAHVALVAPALSLSGEER